MEALAQGIERLQKEVGKLRKEQELARKWVKLHAEFRELGMNCHL